MKNEYSIFANRLSDLEKEIKKYDKKALKLGLPAPSITLLSYYDRLTGSGEKIPMAKVRLNRGGILKIGEYGIKAAIDHGTTNILRENPAMSNGENLDPKWWKASPRCSHCDKIRSRKVTYLLQNASGELIQVGSSCVKDFTGHDPTKALSSAMFEFALTELLEGEETLGGGSWSGQNLECFLAAVSAVVRNDGGVYITRKKAQIDGIASTVDLIYVPKAPRAEKSDYEIAEKAIAWAKGLDPKSDFERNLAAIAEQGFVTPKHNGIAGYIYEGYRRALNRAIEKRIEAKQAETATHIGEVGKRENFEVTIKRCFESYNDWGYTYTYTFLLACGSTLTWFGSKRLDEHEIGDTLNIKATVKKHQEYKGIPQTVVTRVCEA